MKTMLRNPLLRTALIAGIYCGAHAKAADEVKINEYLSLNGYVGVAFTDSEKGSLFGGTSTFGDSGVSTFDAAKVGLKGVYGDFSGYASLFYVPNAADEAGILDAYVTYTKGPVAITAGKYLSWLGYEAFDLVNMYQLTYANTLGAIPAYHDGVKIDYTADTWGAGFNVSDSIIGGDDFFSGDRDFSNDLGYEGYVTYKGIDKLVLWAGFGYQDVDYNDAWQTYDFWATYALTDKITLAGEVAYHEDAGVHGIQGLGALTYAFTDCVSTEFRVGFDDFEEGGHDNMRYTVAPTYTISKNFLVRAEASYDARVDESNGWFLGTQAVLKF